MYSKWLGGWEFILLEEKWRESMNERFEREISYSLLRRKQWKSMKRGFLGSSLFVKKEQKVWKPLLGRWSFGFGCSVPDTNAEYAYICHSYGIERGTIWSTPEKEQIILTRKPNFFLVLPIYFGYTVFGKSWVFDTCFFLWYVSKN